ncbi:unnamed protein product [Vitrella brassicaformis CCMP3155]|uniref:Domain of unknown function at the cortex 1 domain-containing protein n=1 Tax=Vitrella brassicaformis (strain CCMP3155) TaxID=1169540 RepID=A0A0G4GEM5_VITBC|nr:unnamed protein product [Vitrella brassicaformis CCMP3155]|eukprot:CEM27809.1 unnamed protein product [Vitrella brassicaformis CCMP3155]
MSPSPRPIKGDYSPPAREFSSDSESPFTTSSRPHLQVHLPTPSVTANINNSAPHSPGRPLSQYESGDSGGSPSSLISALEGERAASLSVSVNSKDTGGSSPTTADNNSVAVSCSSGESQGDDKEADKSPTHGRTHTVAEGGEASTVTRKVAMSAPPSLPHIRMRNFAVAGGPVDCPVNARVPIEFENEWFKGRFLLLVRTDPLDPYWAYHFRGRQRMFEIQLQGRFKQQPRGIVYFGGEIDKKMSLDFLMAGLSRLILAFVKTFPVGRLFHWSFGNESPASQDGVCDLECPHIVYPLAFYADRMAATPLDQPPPTLGQDIPESDEARIARRERFLPRGRRHNPFAHRKPHHHHHHHNNIHSLPPSPHHYSYAEEQQDADDNGAGAGVNVDLRRPVVAHHGRRDGAGDGEGEEEGRDPRIFFDTKHVYTFSFYSMYCDLIRWRTVKVPGVGNIELKRFWGQQPVRFIVYDVPIDGPPTAPTQTTQEPRGANPDTSTAPTAAAAADGNTSSNSQGDPATAPHNFGPPAGAGGGVGVGLPAGAYDGPHYTANRRYYFNLEFFNELCKT